jgi:hypothetical protein
MRRAPGGCFVRHVEGLLDERKTADRIAVCS